MAIHNPNLSAASLLALPDAQRPAAAFLRGEIGGASVSWRRQTELHRVADQLIDAELAHSLVRPGNDIVVDGFGLLARIDGEFGVHVQIAKFTIDEIGRAHV